MLLITNLRCLQVPEPLGRGFQIKEGMFLINDPEKIKALISANLRQMIGEIEYGCLLRTGHAIHFTTSDPTLEFHPPLMEQFVGRWLQLVRCFLQGLWVVKDHSVHFETGFAEYRHLLNGRCVSSNFLPVLTYKADASQSDTRFSIDDLKAARVYVKKLGSLSPVESLTYRSLVEVPETRFGKDSKRLFRFADFLSSAHANGDLAIRVSLCMTSLEVLFSTNPMELSHRLSERVAYFVGDSGQERKEIFLTMKRAYAVRSKIVHGDRLDKKLGTELRTISVEIDVLLRRVYSKILENDDLIALFDRSSEQLDDYFLNLILEG